MNSATGPIFGRARALACALAAEWHTQRLAHQPTVHAELARYPRDAADAELVFPSKLFE